jgi:hypothetical protein
MRAIKMTNILDLKLELKYLNARKEVVVPIEIDLASNKVFYTFGGGSFSPLWHTYLDDNNNLPWTIGTKPQED